jgi:TolB-like protein/predicted Zn-dependent protease
MGYRAWKFVLRHRPATAAITIAAAVMLLAVGYGLHRKGHTAPVVTFSPAAQSVAVLPFSDLSESQDQEFFSDGLTEELLELLAKVPGLRVIASSSSFSFKGKSNDIPTIARQLNVANILEGSVRKSGRRLRVTTHLVRASTGEELWSETYDRELQDVFQVQDEIAAAVTQALQLKLAAGWQGSSTYRTVNTEAYTQYLLGREFFRRDTVESEQLAIKAFRQAIELDSGYAAAYAGLAMAQSVLAETTEEVPSELLPANQAIALAPGEADGYVARGEIRLYLWDWVGAQADLERALAIEPANSAALMQYGKLLSVLGRMPQATAVVKQATELDPLSARAWRKLAYCYLVNGQTAASHAAYRRALDLHPDSSFARYAAAKEMLMEGRASEALEASRQVAFEGYRLTGIALAEHTLGHDRQSQQALDELIAKAAAQAAYQIAEIYAWRGDLDQAFAWLDRAYQQRDPGLTDIKIDPPFAALHRDARFGALLARMHLQ